MKSIRKTIKNKICSESGASITFALLLFLVCAVTGALILVASTAASGRMSHTAKMDQQYYSVTSAAGLLQEVIEDKTVTVIETTVTETAYRCTDTRRVEIEGDNVVNPKVISSDIEINSLSLENVNKLDLVGDAAYSLFLMAQNDVPTYPIKKDLQLTAAKGNNEIPDLKVSIAEELYGDGTMKLKVSGTEGYTLLLIFTASMNNSRDIQTQNGTPTNIGTDVNGNISWTVTDTTTETARTDYCWTLSEIMTLTGGEE